MKSGIITIMKKEQSLFSGTCHLLSSVLLPGIMIYAMHFYGSAMSTCSADAGRRGANAPFGVSVFEAQGIPKAFWPRRKGSGADRQGF